MVLDETISVWPKVCLEREDNNWQTDCEFIWMVKNTLSGKLLSLLKVQGFSGMLNFFNLYSILLSLSVAFFPYSRCGSQARRKVTGNVIQMSGREVSSVLYYICLPWKCSAMIADVWKLVQAPSHFFPINTKDHDVQEIFYHLGSSQGRWVRPGM